MSINDEFFPKENIICCYNVEGEVNQFEFSIVGKERLIKITINKQTIEKPIDEYLDKWVQNKLIY